MSGTPKRKTNTESDEDDTIIIQTPKKKSQKLLQTTLIGLKTSSVVTSTTPVTSTYSSPTTFSFTPVTSSICSSPRMVGLTSTIGTETMTTSSKKHAMSLPGIIPFPGKESPFSGNTSKRVQSHGAEATSPLTFDHSNEPIDLGPKAEEWAVRMYRSLHSHISTFSRSLESTQDEVRNLGSNVLKHDVQIKTLSAMNVNQTTKIEELEKKVDDLKLEVNKLENYERRNNLLFSGVSEDKWEKAELTTSKIIECCASINITVTEHAFVSVHRLGRSPPEKQEKEHRGAGARPRRPRIIIARFVNREVKDAVWNNRHLMKEGVYVDEDVSKETRAARQELRPYLKAAKQQGKKATFRDDKVFIEGKLYSKDNLAELPPELHSEQIFNQKLDGVHYFYTKHSKLSNHYQCKINFRGSTYNCVEQLLAAEKARKSNDQKTLEKILKEKVPAEQKRLMNQIVIDHKLWSRISPDVVKEGLVAKFTQNPDLAAYLSQTKDLELVEASPTDRRWGIGCSIFSTQKKDRSKWGQNILGKLLMEVREIING